MATTTSSTAPGPSLAAARSHSRAERIADGIVHGIGLAAGACGAAVLVTLGASHGDDIEILALTVYAIGLMAMLVCSAMYNMAPSSRRSAMLRRLDHAAIFAMIAGTYTPFTVLRLEGAWAAGLTATVWGVAAAGIILKLWKPHLVERASIPLYLALGWVIVVALNPLIGALNTSTLILLGVGGLLYSAGVVFHLWERLPFQNAAWHGFVLIAAAVHYAAVLDAIILSPAGSA